MLRVGFVFIISWGIANGIFIKIKAQHATAFFVQYIVTYIMSIVYLLKVFHWLLYKIHNFFKIKSSYI